MGRFISRFDRIVLLSGLLDILLEHVRRRSGNAYGNASAEAARIKANRREIEPRLRRISTHLVDTRRPLLEVAGEVLAVIGARMAWKPESYPSASPYLMVRDAEATLQFLEAVFGATRLRVHPREDGPGIAHAEVRIDDSVIMMGEMPEASEAHVHVYVADADVTFARALAAGGTEVQPLRRSGDGDYRGGVADGNGAVWWISTQEADEV